jgi:thermitase
MPDDTRVTRGLWGASLVLSLVLLCLAAPVASEATDLNVWGAEDVNAPAAWSLSRGAGVKVAVVDTGVFANHEELRGRVIGSDGDVQGHGTAVAGVIVADPDNGKGIEGVAPDASVIPIRAFTDQGTQSASAIVDALDGAGASGARVVNASFGTDPYDRRTGDFKAVEQVLAKHPDTLYVAAAGNEDNDNDVRPVLPCNADSPNLICVGAYAPDRQVWDHTNYGESVDLLAPGVFIKSATTPFSNSYGFFTGTSMSAAYVSGVAALLFAKVPRLTPENAIDLLLTTTRPLPSANAGGARSATGGSPDAVAALQAAVVDSDRDGVYDIVDACPSEAHATTDGCTLPPAATPTPMPTVSPTPTPTPTPPPHHDPAPQLRSVTTSVSHCKAHQSCKRSATVKLTPDRSARVSLRIYRQVCTKGRHCRWTRILSTAVTAGTRGTRVVVRGPHKRSLATGLYRVVAVPSSAAGTGRSATRNFRVR